MYEQFNTAYESSNDEEITQIRRKPTQVEAVRSKLYLVVTDQPEKPIQEFDIDSEGCLLDEVSGRVSSWRLESDARIGNWNRPANDVDEPFAEVSIEDENARQYFTPDFGKAIVRYMEVLEEARRPKQTANDIESDVSVVDTSDIDQLARDLGLTDDEKDFFQ